MLDSPMQQQAGRESATSDTAAAAQLSVGGHSTREATGGGPVFEPMHFQRHLNFWFPQRSG